MPSTRSRKPVGVRKSPLRIVGSPVPVVVSSEPGSAAAGVAPLRTSYTPAEMRQMMVSEFGDWLRTQTNKTSGTR